MSFVDYSVSGSVATITLNRPPVNALSNALIADLEAAIAEAADPGVRVVVLSGRPHFAAGADISEFKAAMESGEEALLTGRWLSKAVRGIELLPKPVIAAVHGYALGGGLEVAMGCDLRFFAEDATAGQPEIKLGIIPGAGGTQRLARLVGMGRARELVYTGRFITAAEALSIGLADRVVPEAELDETAMAFAWSLAGGPAVALGIAKRVITEGWGLPIDEALAIETEGFAESFSSSDAEEGVSAFLEKRDPRFTGK